MFNFGDLAFITFVIGWVYYVRTEWSYDGVERRLNREREAEKAKERKHLKVVK